MDTFLDLFLMGGYATYVWSAYGLVLCLLAIQLLRPWRRWQKMYKKVKNRPHDE